MRFKLFGVNWDFTFIPVIIWSVFPSLVVAHWCLAIMDYGFSDFDIALFILLVLWVASLESATSKIKEWSSGNQGKA